MSFIDEYGDYILKRYSDDEVSTQAIAKELNTYPNKINRVLVKRGAVLRDKSEAQTIALKEGRHKHPTKGTTHSEATKHKIADSVHGYWQEMPDEERQKRVEKSREQWHNMTDKEKQYLRNLAAKGVRDAAKNGSKMEKAVKQAIEASGLDVDFHRKGLISRQELEIDLFVPLLKTAIEIDGPAHFYPIWGEESLQRHLKSDAHKSGLLLANGYILIRVKHLVKSLSAKHLRDVSNHVVEVLKEIRRAPPKGEKRYIELEVV